MNERREFSLLKQTFKAMYNPRWPSYLNLEVMKPARNLHSNVVPRLVVPLISVTFQDSASAIFISLPVNIRSCAGFKEYYKLCKDYLKSRWLMS